MSLIHLFGVQGHEATAIRIEKADLRSLKARSRGRRHGILLTLV